MSGLKELTVSRQRNWTTTPWISNCLGWVTHRPYTRLLCCHWHRIVSGKSRGNFSVNRSRQAFGIPLFAAISDVCDWDSIESLLLREITRHFRHKTARVLTDAGADCNEKCREFDEKGILANETSILFAAILGQGDDQVVKLFWTQEACVTRLASIF